MVIGTTVFDWSPAPSQSPALPETLLTDNQGVFVFQANNKHYVCGGQDGSGTHLSACNTFNIGSTSLSPVASATLPDVLSFGAIATVRKSKIWLIGGRINGMPSTTSLMFDATSESWISEGSPTLPEAFGTGCVVSLNDAGTKFLLLGGDGNSFGGSRKAYVYDWEKDSWQTLPDMTLRRKFIGNMCFRHTFSNGTSVVIVVGGLRGTTVFHRESEIFELEAGTWRPGPPLPYGVEGSLVTGLGGRYFLLGGRRLNSGGTPEFSTAVLEMDTETLEWRERPDLELGHSIKRVAGIVYNK